MASDYPPDWDSRRKRVYKRDDYNCQNCGSKGGERGNATLNAHHIVPKSRGGTHQESNLITICEKCHSAIHDGKQAPTNSHYSDFDALSDLIDRIMELLEFIDGNTTIDYPGRLLDTEYEMKRISLIQDLGEFSIKYDAPDQSRQRMMDNFIQDIVDLLKFPEDVWETKEQNELSDEEVRKYGRELTKKRSQRVSGTTSEIIDTGLRGFFKTK